MNKTSRIYVAGHAGLVGSALMRRLSAEGYASLITRKRSEMDLTDRAAVERFFAAERPEYVFLAAARVGGIQANNQYPAEFILANLLIQAHVIDAAWRHGVSKLLFLGSSCIYPREAPQPIREESLLDGHLEPTNEAYAIAKIAGIKMVQAYRRQYGFRSVCLMPSNLYGPHDNFDAENAHVLPALVRRFHEAKEAGEQNVTVWGTGAPRREFLYVDDLADAAIFAMERCEGGEVLNVGTGWDVTIAHLAELIASIIGYEGTIRYDASRPDGTPRKLLDISRLGALGWQSRVDLVTGLRRTCEWYAAHRQALLRSGSLRRAEEVCPR